jgi:hypothetical protein
MIAIKTFIKGLVDEFFPIGKNLKIKNPSQYLVQLLLQTKFFLEKQNWPNVPKFGG